MEKENEAIDEDNKNSDRLSHITRDYNSSNSGLIYKYVGKTGDNRKIYKSNYPANTPKSVKQKELISLVQNAWSKKDIELTLNTGEKIKVKFDPELSERSNLSKIAFGNRKGSGSEKRITSNLFPDLYEIAENSTHAYGKDEDHTGKENNPAHDDVKRWEYFVTNLVYEEDDGTQIDCYMNIDVKRTTDGDYFYSFAIEKGTAPQTLLAVVTEQSSATVPSNNNIPYGKTAVNIYSMQKRVNNTQSPLPQAIVEGNKTTEALYRDASSDNIRLQRETDIVKEYKRLEALSQINVPIAVEDVKKATGFGEEGSKLVAELANSDGVTFSQAERMVRNSYMAGLKGVEGTKVSFETDTQINAFTAGKKDRVMQNLLEKEQASNTGLENESKIVSKDFPSRVYTFRNGKVLEKEMDGTVRGGLLVTDDARRLTNLQKRYLIKLGVALNKTIMVQSGLRNGDGKRVSGFINDTAVFIDASVKDPIMWTATHEFSHQMQKLAPKEWAKYRAYVVGFYKGKGTYESALETYENAYGIISETELQDEMACDYTDQLFKNEKDLLDFINHSKSLATKIKDMWFAILDKLNIEHKEDARALWEKCYKEATKEARKGKTMKSGEVRYKYDFDNTINKEELNKLHSIGRKSVNLFTDEDIKKTKKFARRMWGEVGTKSPFFRAWFGDWRANDRKTKVKIIEVNDKIVPDNTSPKNIGILLRTKLKNHELFRGDVKNSDTGYKIQIGAFGYNDTLTYAQRELRKKGVSTEEVFRRINALTKINELIQNAVLFDTEVIDDIDNPNRSFMHSFYVAANVDGVNELIKIKVDELESPTNPTKRFYNLNDFEIINKKPLAVNWDLNPSTVANGSKGVASAYISISDLFNLVKTMDESFKPKTASLAVDKDGTPKIVYHSSDAKFDTFDITKSRSWDGTPDYDLPGFYFSESFEDSNAYGGKTGEYYIKIEKPYEGNLQALAKEKGSYRKAYDYLIKEGYDGVIVDDLGEGFCEYIVLKPENIKSATDNIGTFSKYNPNTRYRIASAAEATRKNREATREYERTHHASLVEKYGAIPSGEKPYRDIQVPKKTDKDKKVSQTVRTILEAKATPDEAIPSIEKMVEDGVFSYDVYTDKQAIKESEDYIEEYGWVESLNDWIKDVEKGIVTKQHTAMGWALYNNAVNISTSSTSETERATAIKTSLDILDAMVRHQRNAAQALQATRKSHRL